MITRRTFLKKSSTATIAGAVPFLLSCQPKQSASFTGSLLGPDSRGGHMLRGQSFDSPKEIIREDIVIVGGGVAGLSAARWLKKAGYTFRLLELENDVGGNSRGGKNKVSAYPWGAHYLPLPNLHNKDLLSFLEECGTVTGYINGLPAYNEYHLCFDPKERLYINNHWQDGLIPHEGLPAKDRDEIEKFREAMHAFREQTGNDGRSAFEIPLDLSSTDPEFMQLDQISMKKYLTDKGYRSPYLYWYVNYCCADDFGASLNDTSAWAGIHYFASRKGTAANAESDDVLTWPEGNQWLVDQLKKDYLPYIHGQCLVHRIDVAGNGVHIDCFDLTKNQNLRIEAKAIVVATPQFVNKHIIAAGRTIDHSTFHYAPWMVANITLTQPLTQKHGARLCWDNVIYGSNSLGYIHAQHQDTGFPKDETVITYYRALTGTNCRSIRQVAHQTDFKTWTSSVIDDLKPAHTNIASSISNMDVWIWGHGMIRPQPGFIWSENRLKASASIDNKIFFAHSDLSGMSLFEEGFYAGIKAARQLMSSI